MQENQTCNAILKKIPDNRLEPGTTSLILGNPEYLKLATIQKWYSLEPILVLIQEIG